MKVTSSRTIQKLSPAQQDSLIDTYYKNDSINIPYQKV